MKKELLFAFIAIFTMSLTAITGGYAKEIQAKNIALIDEKVDLNADGFNDEILLVGTPYEQDESIFKQFQFTIKLSNGKKFVEKLEYGLSPEMTLIDIDKDGKKDIFLNIPTGEKGGGDNQYLFSIKNSAISLVPIPTLLHIDGQFTNGYKAKISIPAINKSHVFDLMINKEKYESLGMYANGKLNMPTELVILPYGKIEPVKSADGQYELKAIQKISGISESDSIAYVESFWQYNENNWELVKTEVKEAKETTLKETNIN